MPCTIPPWTWPSSRKTATAALGICCHADTAQLVIPLASSAPLRERRPFRRCHAALHHVLELTGIHERVKDRLQIEG